VLELGPCGKSREEWHHYNSDEFRGFVIGFGKRFMACWNIGKGAKSPYNAKKLPLRKMKRMSRDKMGIGCWWNKVPVK